MSTPATQSSRLTVVERAAAFAAGLLKAAKLDEQFLVLECPPGSPLELYKWDGKRWAAGSMRFLERFLYEEALAAGIGPTGDFLKHLRRHIENALLLVKSPLDQNPHELNTPVGVLDLKTGRVSPHSPQKYHSKITRAAPTGSTRNSKAQAFIERLVPDHELRRELQRGFGLALLGENPTAKIFILRGTGGNGKTTLLQAFEKALGDYGHTLSSSAFVRDESHTTGLTELEGRRMCRVEELPRDKSLAVERLKDVSGSDVISARRMRGNYKKFKVSATLFTTLNAEVNLPVSDPGLRRRLVIIDTTPDKLPGKEAEKLKAELESEREMGWLLAWAMEGLKDFWADPDWQSEAVTGALDYEASERNPIFDFLNDWTVPDPQARTPARDLYDAYLAWRDRMSHDTGHALTQNSFGRALTASGYPGRLVKIGGKPTKVRVGLRLKGEALDAIGKSIMAPVTYREMKEDGNDG